MEVSKALQRLLRILDLEEELRRRELEIAQRNKALLERALSAAGNHERNGRRLTIQGIEHSDLPDRLAGNEELKAGERHAAVLQFRLAQASLEIGELTEAFLSKRVERKQAEALVDQAEERESMEANRRTQQSLDDWYLSQASADASQRDGSRREDEDLPLNGSSE